MAVVFDWDGTITNIWPMLYEMTQKLCDIYGKPLKLSSSEVKAIASKDGFVALDKLILGDDYQSSPLYLKGKAMMDAYEMEHFPPIFDDVLPSIKRLKEVGMRIYLVSRAKWEGLAHELKSSGLRTLFDDVIEDTTLQKDEALRLLFRMHPEPRFSPKGIYYIGDLDTDAIMSRKAFPNEMVITPALVSRGIMADEPLSKYGFCFPTIEKAVDAILAGKLIPHAGPDGCLALKNIS